MSDASATKQEEAKLLDAKVFPTICLSKEQMSQLHKTMEELNVRDKYLQLNDKLTQKYLLDNVGSEKQQLFADPNSAKGNSSNAQSSSSSNSSSSGPSKKNNLKKTSENSLRGATLFQWSQHINDELVDTTHAMLASARKIGNAADRRQSQKRGQSKRKPLNETVLDALESYLFANSTMHREDLLKKFVWNATMQFLNAYFVRLLVEHNVESFFDLSFAQLLSAAKPLHYHFCGQRVFVPEFHICHVWSIYYIYLARWIDCDSKKKFNGRNKQVCDFLLECTMENDFYLAAIDSAYPQDGQLHARDRPRKKLLSNLTAPNADPMIDIFTLAVRSAERASNKASNPNDATTTEWIVQPSDRKRVIVACQKFLRIQDQVLQRKYQFELNKLGWIDQLNEYLNDMIYDKQPDFP